VNEASAADNGQTTVRVQLDSVYYELPRWCVGAKMTGYSSDVARSQQTTPDGKTWLQCIKELKLGFMGASMYRQGQPPSKGKPERGYDNWRIAAGAVVESGGGVMIEYMAGVGAPPGMPWGTTAKPEAADNIDRGAWGVQNCVDWADYMASVYGRDKIFLFEFYNEPACMRDAPDGSRPNGGFWYSYTNFKNPDELAWDWAINHQQDYYQAVKTKYPSAVLCGASYAAPAANYSPGDAKRWTTGYPGARVSAANPNTRYEDALSLHCYGYEAGHLKQNQPGAAAGTVQAIFNSIFYPVLDRPGRISGYKAGVDQWVEETRRSQNGKDCRLVDTEWWVYSPEEIEGRRFPVGGKEGSHQAVADVLGWIVHCQNADRWQFVALQYHMANVSAGGGLDAQGRPTWFSPQDGLFCDSGDKVWRTGRYFALKDISARMANNYPVLVRSTVTGPNAPASPRDNSPGTQIQACAGLSKDKSSLAVCLANIGDTTQTVEIAYGNAAKGAVHGVAVPASLDVEVPLTQLSPQFTDDSHRAVTVTLEGYTAALVEVAR